MKNYFKIIETFVVVVLMISQTSCASIDGTFREYKSPIAKTYIGVRRDIAMLQGKTLEHQEKSAIDALKRIFIWPLFIPNLPFIDLPFSFAFDTIFLPYTIPHSIFFSSAKRDES